jgi:hypothetical protein
MVRQAPPELRCCTLTGRMVRSAFAIGENVQVRAGSEPQDHVLEVQEPAGDPAGVFGGRGTAVDVRGETGRGQCPVSAPDARVLPHGPSAARSPPQAAPPARSARRAHGTPQPAAPPVPQPATLTAPLPGKHRTHRTQPAVITNPRLPSQQPAPTCHTSKTSAAPTSILPGHGPGGVSPS